MATDWEKPVHPGTFIKDHIIPTGMSVTEAAKKLGVGRPALSNMLNGNASLSPDMAVRLEKSFGADRQQLLELQAAFDRYNRRGKERGIAARPYVPSFLTIKARQVEEWAERNIDARHTLAVLLRKLIYSTGHDLRRVDFPGYDNAERRGWDGWIEAAAATPWIPEGKSGWEFGADKKPKAKAESAYASRASVPPGEKAECTFVFVTPRNWPGKTEWAESKNKEGDWKAVRALDASDLEQWLEVSIPAQMWFAEQLSMPVSGFETLDRCWQHWAEASEPKITSAIFEPSIIAYRDTLQKWLAKPSEKPFVVAADSTDEAIAFLACLFQDKDILLSYPLAAVFISTETLQTLAESSSPFIPIVYTKEAERELTTLYRHQHCIIVRPRNAVDSEPDIALDLLNHESFTKALADMNIEDDQAERLARESGYSPTILRRRLSQIEAIRQPLWSEDAETAKSLIPMTLVGAWYVQSNADREVVSALSDNRPYRETEESIVRLLQFDDCPVWSVGEYRGVASKIDALFAINKYVTGENFAEFFWLAEYVLSEDDPALDLPKNKRWLAAIYDKIRDHSTALREGICETLVLLSVHGNNLFRERLGIDIEREVSSLIRRLLTPFTLDTLLSHHRDLPRYAEAAPKEFLRLLEEDLKQPQPAVMELLKPVESGPFNSPDRTGLLWALECLAWQHLGCVSVILAQLSRTGINDNWANKPISSLYGAYRSWLPQTAASLEERLSALEMLSRRFPDISWQICIAQLNAHHQIAMPSYRPRWRSDASGAGGLATWKEINEARRKALDLILAWPKHDQRTLGDLVERLQDLTEEDQILVWDLIDTWADSEADDRAKAGLREQIRRLALTRRGRRLEDITKDRARRAYKRLQPRDPIIRYTWLFARHWIEPSADELEDENFDSSKHRENIHKLRVTVMREIWAECGFEGVKVLLSRSDAPDTVGYALGMGMAGAKVRTDFLRYCLSITSELGRKVDGCLQGFLMSMGDEERGAILSAVTDGMDTDQVVGLFQHAPFKSDTWRLLDRYDKVIQDRYWQEVGPPLNRYSEAELMEIIDRLLEARRPRAAFYAIHLEWPQVETSRLKDLLIAVATVDAEPAGQYRLDPYYLSEALNSLNGRTGISSDEMAQLEFMFITALEYSEHGIPNLERQIAESPAAFVHALALVFKRNDDGQDPSEWRLEDPKRPADLALAAYHLLRLIGHIPGTGADGKIDAGALLNWMTEVRRLCAEHGRVEVGDEKIGELLAKDEPPTEGNGGWPCLPICEAMERIASQQIGAGFLIGALNRRGVHSRGMDEGGAQERELAAKYRGWANRRAFDYPYVSSVLEGIAASYDRDAKREDAEVAIRKRLGH